MYIDVTKAVSTHIKSKGISVTTLSQATGIPYSALLPSISGKRRLRADEFLAICDFLEVSPEKFWKQDKAS